MKHKNFINLQLHAGNIVSTTIIFDSHITKVKLVDNEWTTSGQTIEQTAYSSNDFVVTLQDGYVLETVMATNTFTITNLTETTFRIDPTNLEATETTITLTSKLATATKSYDLSTSSKWASLANGEHQVTVVAKADGYKDSNASSAVTVPKSDPSETWVLNETLSFTNVVMFSADFTSNNQSCTKLYTTFSTTPLGDERQLGYGINGVDTLVYTTVTGETAGWTNTAYRTITFDTAPTGSLLTWLQENGTKQS